MNKSLDNILVVLVFFLVLVQAQSNGCAICEKVVAAAELFIANDPSITEQEVEHYLNLACNISFLKPYEAECENLMFDYADVIVQELFSGTPGAQVCAAVDLCDISASRIAAKKAARHFVPVRLLFTLHVVNLYFFFNFFFLFFV